MMRLLGQCLLLNLVFGTTFFLRSGDLGVRLNLMNLTWNVFRFSGFEVQSEGIFSGPCSTWWSRVGATCRSRKSMTSRLMQLLYVYKACARFVFKGAGLYFGDFSRGPQLKFCLFGVSCKQCCL